MGEKMSPTRKATKGELPMLQDVAVIACYVQRTWSGKIMWDIG